MSLLDILLAVILGLSIGTGFAAGFARVGIGFIASVTGLLFGFWYYAEPAQWLRDHWTMSATTSNLLGFLVVFLAFVTAGAIVGKILAKLFKWTGLGWLDRLGGGAFGLVRGVFLCVIAVAALLAFSPRPVPNWMSGSVALPYVIDASDWCARVAPEPVKNAFRDSMFEIRKLWEDNLHEYEKKRDAQKKKLEKVDL